MLEKLAYNFFIAVESITFNKLRALLTSLGIIFGVASVISMLAIGTGAQEEILGQIKLLGANNIIIQPIQFQEEGAVDEEASNLDEKNPFSPGLTIADAESIAKLIPGVQSVSPEVINETTALRAGLRRSTKLVGVGQAYFENSGFELSEGSYFSEEHFATSAPVAIIGQDVKTKFFTKEKAIGNKIKCGRLWLTVIGVLEDRNIAVENIERLGIRNYDLDIYTPISTQFIRYENRALLTEQDIQEGNSDRRRGNESSTSHHQLDRLVVRVEESEFVKPVADVVSRMLERRHYGVVDYEVIIPEVLLQQERQTQDLFNIVLAAIASISLIVGGIGIMNIMLASVMERIREIGVRRAVGATKQDISYQFVIEAMTLSFTGGILGILLGIGFSLIIQESTGINTIVSFGSVALSFLVSVSIGLIFGILPAKRASEKNPVEALRHE
ncbi:MAG: ABC transporter permease [Rhodothermales bacterium]